MPNVTKSQLVHIISDKTELNMADIKRVVDGLLDAIGDRLASGDTIELRGFGTFSTRLQKERPVRNPRTGQRLMLKEQMVPSLKFSDEIKDRVAGLR